MLKKFLYWSPRIISILFILFLSVFSLDVFSEYQGWKAIGAFLIHLTIPIVLLLAIVAAWKWDLVGAVVFFGFAIWYVWTVGLDGHWSWYLSISGPAALVGLLYLLSWFQKRQNAGQTKSL